MALTRIIAINGGQSQHMCWLGLSLTLPLQALYMLNEAPLLATGYSLG